MGEAVWPRVLLVLLVLPLLAVFAAASESDDWELEEEAPRQLTTLSDQNFEHDTQASTGQTTGYWLVLFTDAECEACKDAERAVLEAATEQQPIPAQVNVLNSPKTCKRLLVSHVPELRLFRDRRMFVFKGEWNAASVSAFIQGGWKDAVAQEVPADTSAISEFLEGLRKSWQASLEYFARRPGLLAGIGAILATASYAITRRILGLPPLQKMKTVRPRRRPLRKRAD